MDVLNSPWSPKNDQSDPSESISSPPLSSLQSFLTSTSFSHDPHIASADSQDWLFNPDAFNSFYPDLDFHLPDHSYDSKQPPSLFTQSLSPNTLNDDSSLFGVVPCFDPLLSLDNSTNTVSSYSPNSQLSNSPLPHSEENSASSPSSSESNIPHLVEPSISLSTFSSSPLSSLPQPSTLNIHPAQNHFLPQKSSSVESSSSKSSPTNISTTVPAITTTSSTSSTTSSTSPKVAKPSNSFNWKEDNTTPKVAISRLGANNQPSPVSATNIPIAPKNVSVASNVTAPVEQLRKRKLHELPSKVPVGHNAVERRYRTNLNNSLSALRNLIPALQHLQPDSSTVVRRKNSNFGITNQSMASTGLVDGIEPANKLSKGVILDKTIEYVSYLQRRRDELEAEVQLWRQSVSNTIDKENIIAKGIEQKLIKIRADILYRHSEDNAKLLQGEPFLENGAKRRRQDKSSSTSSKNNNAKGRRNNIAAGNDDSSGSDFDDADENITKKAIVSPTSATERNVAPKALFAVFSGVSFLGGMSFEFSRASQQPNPTDSNINHTWELNPHQRPVASFSARDSFGKSTSSLVATAGMLSLFICAMVLVNIFIIWPLSMKLRQWLHEKSSADKESEAAQILLDDSSRIATQQLADRDSIIRMHSDLQNSLGSISRYPILGLVIQTLYLCQNITWPTWWRRTGFIAKDDIQKAMLVVRQAEIETCLGDNVSLRGRLHTLLRLTNLIKMRRQYNTSEIPEMLSISRMKLTRVLLVCSLINLQPGSFGFLSDFCRVLWDTGSNEREKNDNSAFQQWSHIARTVDLDYALRAYALPLSAVSPSNTTPLLRICEYKCEQILLAVWESMFQITVSRSVVALGSRFRTTTHNTLAPIVDDVHTVERSQQIDDVVEILPKNSPVRTLALATKAFYLLLCVDETIQMRASTRHQKSLILSMALDTFAQISPTEFDQSDYACLSVVAKLIGHKIPSSNSSTSNKMAKNSWWVQAIDDGNYGQERDMIQKRHGEQADIMAFVTARYALLLRRFCAYSDNSNSDSSTAKEGYGNSTETARSLHAESVEIRRLVFDSSFMESHQHKRRQGKQEFFSIEDDDSEEDNDQDDSIVAALRQADFDGEEDDGITAAENLENALDSCVTLLRELGRNVAGLDKNQRGSLSDDSGCEMD